MRSVILYTLLFFVFIYSAVFSPMSFSVLCLRSNTLVFSCVSFSASLYDFLGLFHSYRSGLCIASKMKTVFRFLFGLSMYGSYALLLGLICGYPMGAKLDC